MKKGAQVSTPPESPVYPQIFVSWEAKRNEAPCLPLIKTVHGIDVVMKAHVYECDVFACTRFKDTME